MELMNFFKLEKLRIEIYGNRRRIGLPKETLKLMFNPESYSLSYKNEYSDNQGINSSSRESRYILSSPESLSLKIIIDGTGTVDFALDSTGTALPLVQGGQYRALAKYTNQPLPMFPGVPSLSEAAGLPSIDESSTWIAIAAPAGTPRPIVEKIQNAVARIYADKPTRERLDKVGINAVNSTSDELIAFIRSETSRWSQVLKENSHLLKMDQ